MYLEYFGFKSDPFKLTPDPKLFFPSSVHSRAKAYLEYGLNQGEGFIVITGDVGAGKTTLVTHLLSNLDKDLFVAANIVTSQLKADEVLMMVARAFNITVTSQAKADVLGDISDFLKAQLASGKRCLLIVDEAQTLSFEALEELRMLSNIQVDGGTPLQSFLIGQPQFRATMAQPDLEQLRQRVIASYHLYPVSEEETRDYLEYRLREVGWTDNPTIDEDVFPQIYEFTGGVPRRINLLASRLLLALYLSDETNLTKDIVKSVNADLEAEHSMFEPEVPEQPEPSPEVLPGPVVSAVSDAALRDIKLRMDSLEGRLAVLESTLQRYRSALQSGMQAATDYLREN